MTSTFDSIAARAHAAIMGHFGASATFTLADASASASAELLIEEGQGPAGFGGQHQVLVLRLDPADYQPAVMAEGAAVSFGGTAYQINEVRPRYNDRLQEFVLRRT
jgi:hypothetical protein